MEKKNKKKIRNEIKCKKMMIKIIIKEKGGKQTFNYDIE